MADPTDPPLRVQAAGMRAVDLVLIVVVLSIAAAVRLSWLGSPGYSVDELWTAELAVGRGSTHLHLPLNVLVPPPPPDLFRISDAPPWWHVWTHMECTHPPLYFVALRLWIAAFGQGDVTERMLSVVCSMLAIALLYDAARLHNGRAVAFWAATLMALAQPQIDLSRQTRNYAMLELTALAAIDALVRIEHFGINGRRCIALTAAVLATLLTHYFCIGAVGAMGLYAMIRLPGRARSRVFIAFIIAGIVFAIGWGPFMWRQRALFATDDTATRFLQESGPQHLWLTLQRVTLIPAAMLAKPRLAMVVVSSGMVVLYVLPLLLLRRRPDLLLWCVLLIGVVAPLVLLDLARGTGHLAFVRYPLLAGPAVYVLVPGLMTIAPTRWVCHAIPAAAAIACALAAPDVYHPRQTDTRLMAAEMGSRIRAEDLLVFGGEGNHLWEAQAQYMMLSRYQRSIRSPMALVDRPVDGQVLDRARRSRYVFAFSVGNPLQFLPGFRLVDSRLYVGGGGCAQLAPPAR
ncbi:MAG TPA: glycosyltransferase family 39 protein [Tepidisphaeraceae bacterium]|nr:glycosyltransferase family 39 protein [Tepidisphaeraceae bacterium]